MSEEMRDLKTIQHWMQAVIMHPGGVRAGVDSAESRQHIEVLAQDIEQVVTRSTALSAIARLGIYSYAYFARLQEVLRAEYPVLLHALGEKLFNLFIFDYLQHYPSRSYTLNRLGENFPRYLMETRPDGDAPPNARETWPDFIIDLATLERAFNEIFDGTGVEGHQILSSNQLETTPTAQLLETRLVSVVCFRLLAFRYPVSQYFSAVREKRNPDLPEPAMTFVVMTRRDYVVRIHEITRRQHDLLSALAAGQPIGLSIKLAEAAGPDPEALSVKTALTWLADWTEKGFFSAAQLTDNRFALLCLHTSVPGG